jgi:hypothetical protein
VVERLSSKDEVLNSNPITTSERERERETEIFSNMLD